MITSKYTIYVIIYIHHRRFQQLHHLNVTGVIDEKTEQLMKSPRCGIKDFQVKLILHINHPTFCNFNSKF